MRRLTRRHRIAAIALAVTALCLLTLDLGGASLRPAHAGVRGVLGALYRGTDSVLGPARAFVQGIPGAGSNRQRIAALEHVNDVLRGELAAAAAHRVAAGELSKLQTAADSAGYPVLPARVIAFGPGQGFDWTVTLDVGTSSGVRLDQTVTDGVGLVGRVLHADPSTSVVLLAADPGSGVGARDLRTGQIGVADGAGTQGFTFVPLDPSALVRVGDQLVTGPAGESSFVAGLSLGTVTAVRRSADGITRAQVAAATSPTGLDLVGVILAGGQPAPRAPLTPATAPPVAAGKR